MLLWTSTKSASQSHELLNMCSGELKNLRNSCPAIHALDFAFIITSLNPMLMVTVCLAFRIVSKSAANQNSSFYLLMLTFAKQNDCATFSWRFMCIERVGPTLTSDRLDQVTSRFFQGLKDSEIIEQLHLPVLLSSYSRVSNVSWSYTS